MVLGRGHLVDKANLKEMFTMEEQGQKGLRRGAQAAVKLKAGIVGGGKACRDLLEYLTEGRLSHLGLEIIGVADPNPDAPGYVLAKEMGIFVTHDFQDLYNLPGLNLLIELTGSMAIRERMIRTKPLDVSSIDHRGARLIWDLIQMELEKQRIQQEAEKKVKQERDWVQKILDSLPDQIIVLDPEFNVIGANKRFLDETSLEYKDIIMKKCYQISHPRSDKCHVEEKDCPLTQVLKTKKPYTTIKSYVNTDGKTVYEEIIATPITDKDGNIIQVIENIRDVTDRIFLAKELQEMELKLSQFLESAHDIICIKDLQGHYIYINPAGLQIINKKKEEVIGKTDLDIFPKSLANNIRRHDLEVIKQKKTLSYVEHMKLHDTVRYFHTVRFPILDYNGEMVSFAIISRDMTEEKKLEDQVRAAKEYLENILTNSTDIVITTDLDGRIVTFNKAGEHILGYTKDEILGKPAEILWKDPQERKRVVQLVMDQGAVTNYNTVLVGKEGHEVEISLSLSLLRDGQGKVIGTVGISRDITEENRLRKRLMEQERLAAVGQTVAGITHCMKNIINGLKGGAYLVETAIKRKDDDLLKEGWDGVKRSIDWIGRLSLDMLSYCRESGTGLLPLNLDELVKEALEMLMPSFKEAGIQVEIFGKIQGQVLTDPDGLKRILLNLLSNAVDACREKEYVGEERPKVEIHLTDLEKYFVIEIKDNGIGMDEVTKEKVFTRFFTTKGNKGTGLGLCVTHKVVQEIGGEIEFQSQKGVGTTFRVILPKGALGKI